MADCTNLPGLSIGGAKAQSGLRGGVCGASAMIATHSAPVCAAQGGCGRHGPFCGREKFLCGICVFFVDREGDYGYVSLTVNPRKEKKICPIHSACPKLGLL